MNKRFGKRVILLLCFILVFLVSAAASAQESKEKTVKVAVLDYPNFLEFDESGDAKGYACQYLYKISLYTGWKYEYIKMSFSDAEKALENGEIDIVPGSQYTKERAQLYDYSSNDMGENNSVLCVPKKNTSYNYNDFENYGGMKIGVLKGSIRGEKLQDRFEKLGVKSDITYYDTDEKMRDALEDGSVDAILMASFRLTSDYKVVASFDAKPIYFTTNPEDPSIKKGIDEAQKIILDAEPYYAYELQNKYYQNISYALAFTNEEEQYLNQDRTITVAMSKMLESVEYYDEKSGEFKGFVVDIFEKISQETGIKFEFAERQAADKMQKMAAQGDIQMIASFADSGKIEQHLGVTATDNVFRSTLSFVSKNTHIADADNDTIALPAGYPFFKDMAQKLGYTHMDEYASVQECIEAVNDGKADATLISTMSVTTTLGHAYYRNITSFVLDESEKEYCFGVYPGDESEILLSIMNKAIASITQYDIEQIRVQTMINSAPEKNIRDIIYENTKLLGIIFILFLIFMILVSMYLLNRKRYENIYLEQINSQLSDAVKEKEDANKAKTEFLSRMSHDIRTPLNAILGLTSKEMTSGISEEQKDEYMAQVHSSGSYLLGIINDVLDMSKIESNKMILNPEPYTLKELIATINTVIKEQCIQKHIDFEVQRSQVEVNCIIVDKVRFNQIFINLLSNAVKFTPKEGKIQFIIKHISFDGDYTIKQFIVKDTGVGMSKEFLPFAFDSFSQELNKESSPNDLGTGLGLSIVKQLVDAMGGTISVDSEIGKGTTFIVELKAKVSKDLVKKEQSERDLRILRGKHILVCEDHPVNAQIAVKLLEKAGCIVDYEENGELGLKRFAQSECGYYDAILMDIRMPVMDGIETTKAIRQTFRGDAKKVPIIAMTANAFNEDAKESISAGMNEHLSKPLEPAILYKVLIKDIGDNLIK